MSEPCRCIGEMISVLHRQSFATSKIEYCPLHAAAPQLAEALRASHGEVERLSEWLGELGRPRQDKTCAVLDSAEAALKAAGIEP